MQTLFKQIFGGLRHARAFVDVDIKYRRAHTWGGAMCLSRNHMTFFGQLAPNVYGSLCCNGLGTTRGTMGGHLLANWLAGDRDDMIDFLLNSEKPCANPPQPFLSMGVNLNLMMGQHKAGMEA